MQAWEPGLCSESPSLPLWQGLRRKDTWYTQPHRQGHTSHFWSLGSSVAWEFPLAAQRFLDPLRHLGWTSSGATLLETADALMPGAARL